MENILNVMYLNDTNPRYVSVKQSKNKIKKINSDSLNTEHNELVARKLIEYEGDYKDLLDLITSIIEKGFREKANQFFLLELDEKYLVADGNRRMLSILLINKILDVDKVFPEEVSDKCKSNLEKIKKIIDRNHKKVKLKKENHNIYKNKESDIDEMFKDILYRHTGSGNGKRDWPRGKMLEEIYEIYVNSSTHEEGVSEVEMLLGVTNAKAESDIKSSVLVMTLLNEYNNKKSVNKIDPLKIAPSSTELILSTNFDKSIIDHESNTESKKCIRDLFKLNVVRDKESNNKWTLDFDKIEILEKKVIIDLLIEGFWYADKKEKNKATIEDKERDNDENKGLIRNKYYSTRSWSKLGTEKLINCLNWPQGALADDKISQIKNNNDLVLNLTLNEIDDEKINSELEKIFGKEILLNIKELLFDFENFTAKPVQLTEFKNNHIWTVLKVIYSVEYNLLLKTTSATPTPIGKKQIISQLSVLRTMLEMMNRFLFYSCMNLVYKNNESIEDWIKKIGISKPDETDAFLNLIKQIFIETDSAALSTIFASIFQTFQNRFFPDVGKIMKVTLDFIDDPELNEKMGELCKIYDKFQELYKSKGNSLSLPIHYIEKFVSEISLKSFVKLNKDFIKMETSFSEILEQVNGKIQLLIYNDIELKKFLNK